MTIRLNGVDHRVEEGTDVRTLVEEVQGDKGTQGVAVAIDHEVIPRSEWEGRVLTEGTSVEIIKATQGG
ncbi:MAG: sulfur carrier protein ThiS [Flavobacteriales bacterium]